MLIGFDRRVGRDLTAAAQVDTVEDAGASCVVDVTACLGGDGHGWSFLSVDECGDYSIPSK